MERAVIDAIVIIAAVTTIVWSVVSLIDRWVREKRKRRMEDTWRRP